MKDQVSLNVSGKLHRIYRENNGDIVVNHAGSKKQNGSYDKINLSDMAGVKSVKGGVKATKDWHKDHPHANVKKFDTPAWTRSEGKNPEGGLNAKGRASAKAQGHNLKPPVKTGDNPRRKSFLSRMGNMPGPEHKPNGEPTRLLLSLQKWGASSKADAKSKAAAMSVNKGLPSIARSQYKELKASGKLAAGEKYEGAVNPNYLLGRMRLKAYGEGPGGKYHVGRSGYTRGKLKSNPTANRSAVELRDATDQRRLLRDGLIPTGTKKTKYGRVDSRMKSSSYKESGVGKSMVSPGVYKPASKLTTAERKAVKTGRNYANSRGEAAQARDTRNNNIRNILPNPGKTWGVEKPSKMRRADIERGGYIKVKRNVYVKDTKTPWNDNALKHAKMLPKMRRPTIVGESRNLPPGYGAAAANLGSKSSPRYVFVPKLGVPQELGPERAMMHEAAHANTKRPVSRMVHLQTEKGLLNGNAKKLQMEEARADRFAAKRGGAPKRSYRVLAAAKPIERAPYISHTYKLWAKDNPVADTAIKGSLVGTAAYGANEKINKGVRRLPTSGRWKHLSGQTSPLRIVGPHPTLKDHFEVIDNQDVRRILPRSSIVFVKPKNVSKSMEYSRGMYSSHALPKLDKNKRYDGTDLSDMPTKDRLKNNVVTVAPAVGSLGLTGTSLYNSQKARKILRNARNARADHFVGLLNDNPHKAQAAVDQYQAAYDHAGRVLSRSKKQLKGSVALLAVGTANNVRLGAERHKLYKQKNGQKPIIKSMDQSRFGGSGAVGYNIEDIEKGVRLDKFAETKAGKRYLKYDAHVLPKRPKRDEKGIPYVEAKYKATKEAKRDAAIAAVLAGGTGTGVALNKSYDDKPKPVWEKPNPNKESDPLSKKRKASAKARAKAAGRPYPNLIDNMAVSVNKAKYEIPHFDGQRKAYRFGRKTGVLIGIPVGAGTTLGAIQAKKKIEKAEQTYDAYGNPVTPRQPLMSGNAKLGAVGGAVGLAGVQRVASAGTLPSRLQGQADAAAHRVAFQERLANEQLGRVQAANQLRGRSNRRRQTRIHQYYSNKAQANLGEARAKQIVADNALKAAPRKKAAHIKSGAGLIATGGSLGALAIYNNAQDRKIKAKAK